MRIDAMANMQGGGASGSVSLQAAQAAAADAAQLLQQSSNVNIGAIANDLRTVSQYLVQIGGLQNTDFYQDQNLYLVANFIQDIPACSDPNSGYSGLALFANNPTSTAPTMEQMNAVDAMVQQYAKVRDSSSSPNKDQWTDGLTFFCNALNAFSSICPPLNTNTGPDFQYLLFSFTQEESEPNSTGFDMEYRLQNDPLFGRVFSQVVDQYCSQFQHAAQPTELGTYVQNLQSALYAQPVDQDTINQLWGSIQLYFTDHGVH
jgi:hypothetical protein